MFRGRRTYKEFVESEEGIATNVLATRLKSLTASGIITARPDSADRRKLIYALTQKGADLGPILIDLAAWASKYEGTRMPPELKRRMQEAGVLRAGPPRRG